jgi:hypothetical protein
VLYESKTLRLYQSDKVASLYDKLVEGPKVALISPPGSGKSLKVSVLLARLQAAHVFDVAVIGVPQTHIKGSFSTKGLVVDKGGEHIRRNRVDDLTETCDHEHTSGSKLKRFKAYIEGEGSHFAYVCSHATLQSDEALRFVRAGDMSRCLLVLDEGHHAELEGEGKLTKMRAAWLEAGGAVLVVTATPYRSDNTSILDESWARVTRSIAEQAADGFAPKYLESYYRDLGAPARTKDQLDNGIKPKRALVKRIVNGWTTDDAKGKHRPKTIVIVPQNDSQGWTKLLLAEFKRAGARVFDATGTSKEQQLRFRDELSAEAKRLESGGWKASQWDVMIGCKRFDEGTDWACCSHVYVIGHPGSINTTVQRWGASDAR